MQELINFLFCKKVLQGHSFCNLPEFFYIY